MKRFNSKKEALAVILKALSNTALSTLTELNQDSWDWVTDDFNDELEKIAKDYECDFRIGNGVSRGALIFEDLDLVIKVPFTGVSPNEDEDEYSRSCSIDSIGYSKWGSSSKPLSKKGGGLFQNANNSTEYCWDYCYTELILRHLAKKAKLSAVFAPIKFVGKVGIFNIYSQNICKTVAEDAECICEDSQREKAYDIAQSSYDNMEDFEINFFGMFLEVYGVKLYQRFLKFIKSNKINDLHDGNIGIMYGNPVILDYAGFHG